MTRSVARRGARHRQGAAAVSPARRGPRPAPKAWSVRPARATRGLLTLTLPLALLVACAEDPADAVVVSEGTVRSAADLPEDPDGEVVLTVSGGPDGQRVELTLEQLAALRTVTAELYEPFVDERLEFTGVPLRDLAALVGAGDDGAGLDAVALNEYAVEIPADVTRSDGAFLATLEGGEPIPVEEGGPTRVVLADDHPRARDETLWIWSVATLDVAP